MRPSLVPGLVAAAERNARRALKRRRACSRSGRSSSGAGENDQRIAAAAACGAAGRRPRGEGRHWSGGGGVDAFDAKSDAMALLAALGVANAVQIVPGGPAFLHPGRSATLQFGPKNVVGWFGQLHPTVCEALDAEGPIVAFEIVLDAMPAPKARPTKAKPKLERFGLHAGRARSRLRRRRERARRRHRQGGAGRRTARWSSDVGVFDVYQGKGLPEGAKSVAISVTLQPRERTLTDAEIEAAMAKIVAEVSKRTGATLRG